MSLPFDDMARQYEADAQISGAVVVARQTPLSGVEDPEVIEAPAPPPSPKRRVKSASASATTDSAVQGNSI